VRAARRESVRPLPGLCSACRVVGELCGWEEEGQERCVDNSATEGACCSGRVVGG
jgi:hypothetical protein